MLLASLCITEEKWFKVKLFSQQVELKKLKEKKKKQSQQWPLYFIKFSQSTLVDIVCDKLLVLSENRKPKDNNIQKVIRWIGKSLYVVKWKNQGSDPSSA